MRVAVAIRYAGSRGTITAQITLLRGRVERVVDPIDGGALVEQTPRFVEISGQRSRRIKPGSIVHHDHGLPEPSTAGSSGDG